MNSIGPMIKQVKKGIENIEQRLANAERYLARSVNVEGCGYLHLDDWRGNSGHPLWMKNCMIPRMLSIVPTRKGPWSIFAEKPRKWLFNLGARAPSTR